MDYLIIIPEYDIADYKLTREQALDDIEEWARENMWMDDSPTLAYIVDVKGQHIDKYKCLPPVPTVVQA